MKRKIFCRRQLNSCAALLVTASLLLAGCDFPQMLSQQNMSQEEYRPLPASGSMESKPVIDYTVPVQLPNVLIDESGYYMKGTKRAAIRGSKMPDTFRLFDASSGEVVLDGEIKEIQYHEDRKLYSGFADFRGLDRTGDYYIECPYLGRSEIFSVRGDHYEELFEDACRSVSRSSDRRQLTIRGAYCVLQALEWYPEIFADEDKDQIPDVCKSLAENIDSAFIKPSSGENGANPLAQKGQEMLGAALLAKFSFLYRDYDRAFATECLRRSSQLFSQNQNKQPKDAACFQALVELYRATGQVSYRSQIVEYKTYFQNHLDLSYESGYLPAAMTYLNTRQPVDMELCRMFMEGVMDQGESISGLYREMLQPVSAYNDGEEDVLGHATELVCANHVMNNYQYNRITEEFFHYLRGKNSASVDYFNEQNAASYMLVLAQLRAKQDYLSE